MYCSAGLAATRLARDFFTGRDADFNFVLSFALTMSIACWDFFFRPYGALSVIHRRPTACAVGCILSPLCGWRASQTTSSVHSAFV
jgi:hypothetical protein